VFHKSRQSIIANISNDKVLVSHDLDSISFFKNKIIRNYMINANLKYMQVEPFKSFYKLNLNKVLVIDSSSIYNVKQFKPDYVLLTQSPKLNLERLINILQPKQIIADGSNYKSYIEHWEIICRAKKIPFHQTRKKGAFILEY